MIFKTALFCWAAFMAVLWFSANHSLPPAPQNALAVAEPDPAKDHRLRAAGLMVIRVSELNDRLIAQCKRAGRLAPPTCAENARKVTLGSMMALAGSADDEVRFMAFVELVQGYEREMTPLVQQMESASLN